MTRKKKTLKDLKAPVEEKKKDVKPLPNYVNTKQIATIEAKYTLSVEEKNQAGNELAHKEKQLEQIEKDRKDRMASFKAQTDEVRAQIAELSNKVTLGYEYRKFRCEKHLDFIDKLRIFKEVDTGEIIDTRAIEPDDYQLRMPI